MTNGFHFVTTTVLFVEGQPVGYKIFQEDDEFFLEPAEVPDASIHPPSLTVIHKDDRWTVHGTVNQDLIDQVIEDLTTVAVAH
jgi:hypothetical protein